MAQPERRRGKPHGVVGVVMTHAASAFMNPHAGRLPSTTRRGALPSPQTPGLSDRACAIRGGQSAPSHVGKYRAAPFRDDETVYDGERVVQAGLVPFLVPFREKRAGWHTILCL